MRVSLEAFVKIAWFLCGSTWFLPAACGGVRANGLSETFILSVVPVWFHVVPTACHKRRRCSGFSETFNSGVVPVWFHVVGSYCVPQAQALFWQKLARAKP